MLKIHIYVILVLVSSILIIPAVGIYADSSTIPNWVNNNFKWWTDDQIGESGHVLSLQYLVDPEIASIPIVGSVIVNEKVSDSDKTLPITVWAKGESFGTVTLSPFDRSSGDLIPPSFKKTFEKNEFPLTINGTNYRLDQLNNSTTIKVEIGKPLKLQIRMYENEGTNNIQHVTLYLNQHGDKILNDLTETGITFEKGKDTQITDPNNLLESAKITQSIQGIKDVFEFELKFSKEMDTSDLLFRIWDTERNSVDLYVPKILAVIDKSPSSENMQNATVKEPVAKLNSGKKNEQTFSTEIFDQWAGFSSIHISDKEFLKYLGIEGQRIPNWIKQHNAKWVHDGKLTQHDLITTLKNLESRGMLNSF